MEEKPRRNHTGRVVKKASWRKRTEILEEESWRRNHGGYIMEDTSWRKHHGGGHPGIARGTQEAPGGTQEAPGGTQEAPRRYPP